MGDRGNTVVHEVIKLGSKNLIVYTTLITYRDVIVHTIIMFADLLTGVSTTCTCTALHFYVVSLKYIICLHGY